VCMCGGEGGGLHPGLIAPPAPRLVCHAEAVPASACLRQDVLEADPDVRLGISALMTLIQAKAPREGRDGHGRRSSGRGASSSQPTHTGTSAGATRVHLGRLAWERRVLGVRYMCGYNAGVWGGAVHASGDSDQLVESPVLFGFEDLCRMCVRPVPAATGGSEGPGEVGDSRPTRQHKPRRMWRDESSSDGGGGVPRQRAGARASASEAASGVRRVRKAQKRGLEDARVRLSAPLSFVC
jgi:hypothetical protein